MPEKKIIYEGEFPALIYSIGQILGVSVNVQEVLRLLQDRHPDLKDPNHCANCKSSMLAYQVPFDCLNALLLKTMGDHVKHRLRKGMDMTVANQVLISELPAPDSAKRRTCQLSKLGLIAKLRNHNKKHVHGVWVVTRQGFAALRGEPVRKWAMVFRGEIKERSEQQDTPETTTIADAFKWHQDKVQAAIAKSKPPRNDYRALMHDYSPQDWFQFGDAQQGELL